MDDGYKHDKGLYLNTYGYSNECIELLISVLKNKFKLKYFIHYKSG